jgi:multidrug efflux system membrane fusion protein
VINRLRPIEVGFAVPASVLPDIRERSAENALEVAATAAGGTQAATGRLWPGQFVNVALTLGVESAALVVPSAAVQSGQQGTYVFVVKPDGTAESRPVTVARRLGDETVLARGLAEGERVVTD